MATAEAEHARMAGTAVSLLRRIARDDNPLPHALRAGCACPELARKRLVEPCAVGTAGGAPVRLVEDGDRVLVELRTARAHRDGCVPQM